MAANNDNITVELDAELDTDEGPNFYSPYPKLLSQIKEGETQGAREVVEMINENWPADIDELEEISDERNDGDGYSGSFIRSILRSHYAPTDMMNDNGISVTSSENEEDASETPSATEEMERVEEDEEDAWHRVFRMGIRAALQNEINEDDAFEAFGSGFVEGKKLAREMGRDELAELTGN